MTNMSRTACPPANHAAIVADPAAFAALPLVGYSSDIGIETRRCNRCPSTISRPIVVSSCDRCDSLVTATVVCGCGNSYHRCADHGGEAGARRSLHSHAALYHPKAAA